MRANAALILLSRLALTVAQPSPYPTPFPTFGPTPVPSPVKAARIAMYFGCQLPAAPAFASYAFPPTTPTASCTQAPTWGANRGATAIVLFSTAIICLIVPGLGLYHAGLSRSLDAVNAIAMKIIALAAVAFQWFLVGWTLCFSGAMRTFPPPPTHHPTPSPTGANQSTQPLLTLLTSFVRQTYDRSLTRSAHHRHPPPSPTGANGRINHH